MRKSEGFVAELNTEAQVVVIPQFIFKLILKLTRDFMKIYMRRWSALGDLPENASKVKSVEESCKTLKKEADAEISSGAEKMLAAEEQESGCNKAKKVKEG